jgi:fucose permease
MYWGAFALGRFFGIFISIRFTPAQMVIGDLIGAIIAVIIVVADSSSHTALWIGTAIYGVSVGSIYASTVIYVEKLISVNGKLLSALVVFASLGDAVMPLAMGATFKSSSGPIGMMYIAILVASSAAITFISLLIYVRVYQKRLRTARFQRIPLIDISVTSAIPDVDLNDFDSDEDNEFSQRIELTQPIKN